ncbi:MAG: HAD-IA family hydrolase [Clostridia bacterium]|jgi:HAD superfamily hydrolase (TIGR01549 family)
MGSKDFKGKMKYRHFIWDFDGTLYDTYGEITYVILSVLEARSVKEEYDKIFKNLHISLTHTLAMLSNDHEIDPEILKKEFTAAEEAMNVEKAQPFSGTLKLLRACEGFNFMVTNRGASVFRFLDSKDYHKYFTEVMYRDSGLPLKPSSATVDFLISKYGLQKEDILFIGDRDIDLRCAKNAGVDSCYFDSHDILNTVECRYYTKDLNDLYDILSSDKG